jgi:Transposase DDE domain
VYGVFEQLGARKRSTNFCRGQRLGQRDHLIELSKSKLKPAWMSHEDFDQAPDTLTVPELQTGGKILVTTLLCPKQIPKSALKQLYRNRWHIELDLRNIKTTMGMEMLSCKTPAMAIKEIWVYLLGYPEIVNVGQVLRTIFALRTKPVLDQLALNRYIFKYLVFNLRSRCKVAMLNQAVCKVWKKLSETTLSQQSPLPLMLCSILPVVSRSHGDCQRPTNAVKLRDLWHTIHGTQLTHKEKLMMPT